MKTNDLTLKQEAFCKSYIRSGDKSAAYREAYSTSNMKNETIHSKANLLSNKDNVRARIEELRSKVAEIAEKKFNITSEEMLRHLNILRNARIDEYVEYKNGKLIFKDFDKLSNEQLMCIESIKETKYGIEIKLHGKDWTIEKINKHIGFYEKDNDQKNNSLGISDPEERDKRIAELINKAKS
jgi:phage terminase small subunit